jgi:hypothetical protein
VKSDNLDSNTVIILDSSEEERVVQKENQKQADDLALRYDLDDGFVKSCMNLLGTLDETTKKQDNILKAHKEDRKRYQEGFFAINSKDKRDSKINRKTPAKTPT